VAVSNREIFESWVGLELGAGAGVGVTTCVEKEMPPNRVVVVGSAAWREVGLELSVKVDDETMVLGVGPEGPLELLMDPASGLVEGPQSETVRVTVETETERTVTVTMPLSPMTMGVATLTTDEEEMLDGEDGNGDGVKADGDVRYCLQWEWG